MISSKILSARFAKAIMAAAATVERSARTRKLSMWDVDAAFAHMRSLRKTQPDLVQIEMRQAVLPNSYKYGGSETVLILEWAPEGYSAFVSRGACKTAAHGNGPTQRACVTFTSSEERDGALARISKRAYKGARRSGEFSLAWGI